MEIDVDMRDNQVKRLRPRHNPHVNGYWMCDEGRLNYKFVNTDRVRKCVVEHDGERFEALLENAAAELARTIGAGTGRGAASMGGEPPAKPHLVVLASATCTLEELYACKALAGLRPGTTLYVARHVADGVEDRLLRKSDRHPNVKGAELLGLRVVDFTAGPDAEGRLPVVETIPQGAVLLAVGFDYGSGEPLEKFFEKFSRIAIIAARESNLTRMAHVLVPGLTFAEKEGLIVNFEGHIQKLSPALEGLWDKTPPWEVVVRLVAAFTRETAFDTIAGLRKHLATREAAFSGVDLDAVGPTGIRLEAKTV